MVTIEMGIFTGESQLQKRTKKEEEFTRLALEISLNIMILMPTQETRTLRAEKLIVKLKRQIKEKIIKADMRNLS